MISPPNMRPPSTAKRPSAEPAAPADAMAPPVVQDTSATRIARRPAAIGDFHEIPPSAPDTPRFAAAADLDNPFVAGSGTLTGSGVYQWLLAAARDGDLAALGAAISAGADLDAWPNVVRTAAAAGDVDVLRHLAQHGVNLTAPREGGQTPLETAIFHGKAAAAMYLISLGGLTPAVVNSARAAVLPDLRVTNLLNAAVVHNMPEIVRALVAAGVDPADEDAWGTTAFDLAGHDKTLSEALAGA